MTDRTNGAATTAALGDEIHAPSKGGGASHWHDGAPGEMKIQCWRESKKVKVANNKGGARGGWKRRAGGEELNQQDSEKDKDRLTGRSASAKVLIKRASSEPDNLVAKAQRAK